MLSQITWAIVFITLLAFTDCLARACTGRHESQFLSDVSRRCSTRSILSRLWCCSQLRVLYIIITSNPLYNMMIGDDCYAGLLTCYRNCSKVLEPSPLRSPNTEHVKLEELDLHLLVKGVVEQGGISVRGQFILQQGLPGAVRILGTRNSELTSCSPVGVLDLTASNQPRAWVQFYYEELACGHPSSCQPLATFQDEDIACWVATRFVVSARNNRSPKPLPLNRSQTPAVWYLTKKNYLNDRIRHCYINEYHPNH